MKVLKTLALTIVFGTISLGSIAQEKNKIVSIKGNDVYASTILACKTIGLDKLVKPGMKVGILVNSGFDLKGAYTNPDVTLAVISICLDAGAKEIVSLQGIPQKYWQRSPLYDDHLEALKKVRSIDENIFPSVYDSLVFVRIDSFPGAPNLKNLEMVKEAFDVDLFINIPIAKHHPSTILTNSMKNLMGLNTRAFNVTFHLNGPKRNDPEFLATCIAELNLVRKPDLIVCDVTEVITTNGPTGPGQMAQPMRVVAGKDPVAIDSYCAKLIGFDPDRVISVQKGFELGLGEKDLSKVSITEIDYEDMP
ncbi:MAG: hypothetical protein CVT98_00705 [Bacteroidetes bacterium HGW-Bacteroidetes-15]|nr:MAG: hypothetical protein CVT98_00705 [Bacteroidetes bacterium HGW-Bacteroidetes-15]